MTDLCRTDLPTSQKVNLAVLSLATQGDYGSVSALSESWTNPLRGGRSVDRIVVS